MVAVAVHDGIVAVTVPDVIMVAVAEQGGMKMEEWLWQQRLEDIEAPLRERLLLSTGFFPEGFYFDDDEGGRVIHVWL